MITLMPGMMLRYQGEVHRVERVNDCSAAIRPLKPSHRVIVTCAGKRVEFDAPRGLVRISPTIDESLLLATEEVKGGGR